MLLMLQGLLDPTNRHRRPAFLMLGSPQLFHLNLISIDVRVEKSQRGGSPTLMPPPALGFSHSIFKGEASTYFSSSFVSGVWHKPPIKALTAPRLHSLYGPSCEGPCPPLVRSWQGARRRHRAKKKICRLTTLDLDCPQTILSIRLQLDGAFSFDKGKKRGIFRDFRYKSKNASPGIRDRNNSNHLHPSNVPGRNRPQSSKQDNVRHDVINVLVKVGGENNGKKTKQRQTGP